MNTGKQPQELKDKHIVRVQFGAVEDCRRVVFGVLRDCGLSQAKASRIAGMVSAGLRDAGHLGSAIEQHYSAADAAALLGGRCSAWAVKHAKQGDFGPVACDGGDWLIPASGIQAYLDRFSINNVNGNVIVTSKNTAAMVEVAEEKSPKAGGGSVFIQAVAGRDRAGQAHGQTDNSRRGLVTNVASPECVRSARIAADVSSPDVPG